MERKKERGRRPKVWARLGARSGSIPGRLERKVSIHDRLGKKVTIEDRLALVFLPPPVCCSCCELERRTTASTVLRETTASPSAEIRQGVFCAPSLGTRSVIARPT